MKSLYYLALLAFAVGCAKQPKSTENPFFVELNVPIDYAKVTSNHIEEYANVTLSDVEVDIKAIKEVVLPTFENIFVALDNIYNKTYTASNNCFMLYWTSPDSLSRVKGLAGYLLLDSLSTSLYSNKAIFSKMLTFKESDEYGKLEGHRKILVDDLILSFTQSGVNLNEEKLAQFEKLTKELGELTSEYSNNMNSSAEVLVLDEKGAEGLPENFKNTYKKEDGKYEIPVINATNDPIMKNASNEETRKEFYIKFNNRAADKNIEILKKLVHKRHELAKIMGYDSYAAYNLTPKMAKNPETVWAFVNDLIDRAKGKAKTDMEVLKEAKKNELGSKTKSDLKAWDIAYYNNQILKTKFQVDHEKIRDYLPMDQCLQGVFDIFKELLGMEFRKVEKASVWSPEVTMYNVYEGEKLRGRIYLDLFPRPNKESWFYGVQLTAGKATKEGYEVPVSMLLGNFTSPTETLPSLISFKELSTLFHEFGHIIDAMSYEGEFALQADAKTDFIESMSQIFENWISNYEMLSKFAKHYKTGEPFPKEIFDNMEKAKNLSSGYSAIRSLRNCVYDMNLYDKYDPSTPLDTDELWRKIDRELGVDMYVEETHPQSSWIHINTHPVYYYGYLWSEVYAQDMFTKFEKNGLLDNKTGVEFRKLILANGTQRDVVEAVEEFLGRKMNNEAYIKSLGLE